MWEKIQNIGVYDEYPDYLKDRIKLANQICVFTITTITIPFLSFSYLWFKPAISIIIIAFIAYLASFIFNYYKHHTIGRFISSITPAVTITIFHAYFLKPGDTPMYSLYGANLAFSLFPYAVFDWKEKRTLFTVSLIIGLMFVFMPYYQHFFIKDLDKNVFHEKLDLITSCYAFLMSLAIVSTLLVFNTSAGHKLDVFLSEMKEKNKELENSEIKMREQLVEIEKAKIEENKRNWVAEGIAKFGTIFRNQESLHEISNTIIIELVNYLGVNQGGIFIVRKEHDDVEIKLTSTYAYDRLKLAKKSIIPGEGYVGQVYLEKKTIYLKEVPDSYLNITSGLGQANPKCILIVPMIVDDVIEGVIELASFAEFEPYQIEFVEQIGENFASIIKSISNNEMTKQLLEKANQQAEEMRNQEEEMKQNLEELAATQEEMGRKEQELVKKQTEMLENEEKYKQLLEEANAEIANLKGLK